MIKTISGQIKAKAGFMDPDRYGRSDTSAIGRWFWEIDKVLVLLVSVLIGIGLIAVAAASPAAAHRYSGGNVRFPELYYFWRQLAWIAIGIPVMIGISMLPKDRARRLSLFGAAFFFVLLIFVPILGPEINGAKRWISFGVSQVQPSEFLKPFFVVSMAWLLSLKDSDKSLPVFPLSAALISGPRIGTKISRTKKKAAPNSDRRLARSLGSIEMPIITGMPIAIHASCRQK